MSRIQLEMSVEEAMLAMCDGNPGAATVIGQLFQKRGIDALILLCHLDDMEIYGSKIWIAYKDVCKQNIDNLIKMIPERRKLQDAIAKAERA